MVEVVGDSCANEDGEAVLGGGLVRPHLQVKKACTSNHQLYSRGNAACKAVALRVCSQRQAQYAQLSSWG